MGVKRGEGHAALLNGIWRALVTREHEAVHGAFVVLPGRGAINRCAAASTRAWAYVPRLRMGVCGPARPFAAGGLDSRALYKGDLSEDATCNSY